MDKEPKGNIDPRITPTQVKTLISDVRDGNKMREDQADANKLGWPVTKLVKSDIEYHTTYGYDQDLEAVY